MVNVIIAFGIFVIAFASGVIVTLLALDRLRNLHRAIVDREEQGETLSRANRVKTQFLASMSHELRTPLTTIKGFVTIVLNEETGPLNDQQRRFLLTSDRAIDRLTLLVSDLLDISRIEAGQIKMQLRPITFSLC